MTTRKTATWEQEIIEADLDYAAELDAVADFIATRGTTSGESLREAMKEWEFKLRDEARDMRNDAEMRLKER